MTSQVPHAPHAQMCDGELVLPSSFDTRLPPSIDASLRVYPLLLHRHPAISYSLDLCCCLSTRGTGLRMSVYLTNLVPIHAYPTNTRLRCLNRVPLHSGGFSCRFPFSSSILFSVSSVVLILCVLFPTFLVFCSCASCSSPLLRLAMSGLSFSLFSPPSNSFLVFV